MLTKLCENTKQSVICFLDLYEYLELPSVSKYTFTINFRMYFRLNEKLAKTIVPGHYYYTLGKFIYGNTNLVNFLHYELKANVANMMQSACVVGDSRMVMCLHNIGVKITPSNAYSMICNNRVNLIKYLYEMGMYDFKEKETMMYSIETSKFKTIKCLNEYVGLPLPKEIKMDSAKCGNIFQKNESDIINLLKYLSNKKVDIDFSYYYSEHVELYYCVIKGYFSLLKYLCSVNKYSSGEIKKRLNLSKQYDRREITNFLEFKYLELVGNST